MNEQENKNLVVSQQDNVNDSTDYIEALKEMKQNSVDRATYDKLKSENKQLLDALVNGKEIEMKKEEPVDIAKLRKDLFNKDGHMSNLEYVSSALKLRDALIEKGERDPFLPYGDKVTLTAEHYDKAEQVAAVLKECVEFADGDSGIFTAELQRRTKDTMPRYGKR
jgi:5'-3' exonuclease